MNPRDADQMNPTLRNADCVGIRPLCLPRLPIVSSEECAT